MPVITNKQYRYNHKEVATLLAGGAALTASFASIVVFLTVSLFNIFVLPESPSQLQGA